MQTFVGNFFIAKLQNKLNNFYINKGRLSNPLSYFHKRFNIIFNLMADKQQITPWSIYDKFQGDREIQNKQLQNKGSQIPKKYSKASYVPYAIKKSQHNVNIEALINSKPQPSSERNSPRKQDSSVEKVILSGRKQKNILSGKAMKYNTFEPKDEIKKKKSQQDKIRENYNALMNEEYDKTVKAINTWLLIQTIKEELKSQAQNLQEKSKNFSLPKITKNFPVLKQSDSQRYQVQIAKLQKNEKMLQKKLEKKDSQPQRSFETIHIGRVISGVSRQKIVKQFSKQKLLPKTQERLQLKFFPKGLSKKIKFRNSPLNSSKNLLSQLYGKNEEFNDKQIHQKLQLAKRNLKRSRIPTMMKSSVYEEQLNQLTKKEHNSLYERELH